jgi:hypothetical protein
MPSPLVNHRLVDTLMRGMVEESAIIDQWRS